jgi:hypothetical protein
MANINLSTEMNDSGPSNIIGGSTVKLIVMLIVVLLIWGGLIAGKFYLDNKIKATEAQYQTAYAQFLSGKASDVSDFQNRSSLAEGLLKTDPKMNDYLAQVEKSMIPGAYLNSLKYDSVKKEFVADCAASNYNDVAKQIFSFKQNDAFSAVIPGTSTFTSALSEKTPQIGFSLELKLK